MTLLLLIKNIPFEREVVHVEWKYYIIMHIVRIPFAMGKIFIAKILIHDVPQLFELYLLNEQKNGR